MIVDYHAFASRIPNPVRLAKTDIELKLTRVRVGAMTCVEGVRKDIGGYVGRN